MLRDVQAAWLLLVSLYAGVGCTIVSPEPVPQDNPAEQATVAQTATTPPAPINVAGSSASPMPADAGPMPVAEANLPSAGAAAPPVVARCPPGACAPGRCVEGPGDYSCECGSGFSGSGSKTCVNIDDCPSPNPCMPGGECVDGVNTFSCQCMPGYRGSGQTSCEQIDECLNNPCQPGGTCVDGVNTYSCQCKAGYSGTGTQSCVDIDDCVPDKCAPYGKCIDAIDDYKCMCDVPNPDPRICPWTRTDRGIYDSTTGLTWCPGPLYITTTEISPSPSEVEAQRVCATLGCRLPTFAEFQTSPTYLTTTTKLCFVGVGGLACQIGGDSRGPMYAVYCVR